jgi:hypothetical protein
VAFAYRSTVGVFLCSHDLLLIHMLHLLVPSRVTLDVCFASRVEAEIKEHTGSMYAGCAISSWLRSKK